MLNWLLKRWRRVIEDAPVSAPCTPHPLDDHRPVAEVMAEYRALRRDQQRIVGDMDRVAQRLYGKAADKSVD